MKISSTLLNQYFLTNWSYFFTVTIFSNVMHMHQVQNNPFTQIQDASLTSKKRINPNVFTIEVTSQSFIPILTQNLSLHYQVAE